MRDDREKPALIKETPAKKTTIEAARTGAKSK